LSLRASILTSNLFARNGGPLHELGSLVVTLYNVGLFLTGGGNYWSLGPDGSPF
jgi:hypothetical protein